MQSPWRVFAGVVAIALAAVVVFVSTPNSPVPVISQEVFDPASARQDIAQANAILRIDPGIGLDEIAERVPSVVALEGREPSGLAWVVLGVGVGLLAALVISRSGNRFGAHLMSLAWFLGLFGLARALADLEVRNGGLGDLMREIALTYADVGYIPLGVVLGPVLIITFPTGRLPGSRWRWVLGMSAIASFLMLGLHAHPMRYDGRAVSRIDGLDIDIGAAIGTAGLGLWAVLLMASTVSVIIRYRRSDGVERLQLRWMAHGLALAVVLMATSDIAQRAGGDSAFWGPAAAFGWFAVVPAAFLVTIFTYRIYDIDLVVRRSVLFAGLALIVAMAYVASLWLAAALTRSESAVVALSAIGLVAVLFEPARSRLTVLVDRLIYGRPVVPHRVLADLSHTLASDTDVQKGMDEFMRAASRTTSAECAGLWRLSPGQSELIAGFCGDGGLDLSPSDMTAVFPMGDGTYLGVRTQRGAGLRRHENRLLREMAMIGARYLEAASLRIALKARVEELEIRASELSASRRRLGRVVDEVSRGLERDLHDGAQARAVSLSAAIGLARASPGRESEMRDRLLREVDGAQSAIIGFVRGLFPSELSLSGIGSALRVTVPFAPNVIRIHDDGRRTSPEIEAALYFMATEAIQNSIKHAPGSTVDVDVSIGASLAEIEVSDDGPGMRRADRADGLGMLSMTERVAALGGSVTIRSGDGSGTKVTGRIPVAGGGE